MKKILTILVMIMLMLTMVSCTSNSDSEEAKSNELTPITLVLDWTPNTNHTGFYVALEKGYFEEVGLDVKIVQPPEDGAATLVASGKAEFGIDFQDSLVPAFVGENKLPITAVAAVVQHNTSGIVSLKEKGIDSPKGMEGNIYATWDMPIEQAIIQNVVEADGGDYNKIELVPTYVTDVVTGLQTDVDSVWIYYGWDGIACEVAGLDTNYFNFKDINPVFDYYSPVIIANNDFIADNADVTEKFLEACEKGYKYAIENPEDAANILVNQVPELDIDLIVPSQKWLSEQYMAEEETWGYISQDRWDDFYKWLYDNQLIEEEIPAGYGFSNDYLK